MWLDTKKLKLLCKHKGLGLNSLLKKAKVSKTAYYSLARKGSLVPASLLALAEALGVSPMRFISWGPPSVATFRLLEAKLCQVLRAFPRINKENAWHTLIMLERTPLERLEGALRRGRKAGSFFQARN